MRRPKRELSQEALAHECGINRTDLIPLPELRGVYGNLVPMLGAGDVISCDRLIWGRAGWSNAPSVKFGNWTALRWKLAVQRQRIQMVLLRESGMTQPGSGACAPWRA
jgi:hypothetical protein